MNTCETEVKFHIAHPKILRARLRELGARLLQPRTHEHNLRFDAPDGGLRRAHRVLRLRRDDKVTLTYKGPSEHTQGVLSRSEVEFTASSYENARRFLEALGYRVFAVYEKYRTTYALGETQIMLDELPYGDFVEIEGPDVETIQHAARELGLDWDAAIPAGYLALFERLCAERGLDPSNLTFDALGEVKPPPDALSVRPADA